MESPVIEVRSTAERLFPEQADQLVNLCLRGSDFPLGAAHPKMMAHLAGVRLEEYIVQGITNWFVFLVAHYFLLDSALDGQLEDQGDLAYLPLLHLAADVSLDDACRGKNIDSVMKLWTRRASESASAALLEVKLHRTSEPPSAEFDTRCIVGRSNPVILLYEIICLVGEVASEDHIISMLEEFIVIVQESDDLSDWREDFEAGRSTPFLRRTALTADAPHTVEAIERQLYLSGDYERYIAALVRRVDRLLDSLGELPQERAMTMTRMVYAYRNQLVEGLRNLVALKTGISTDAG